MEDGYKLTITKGILLQESILTPSDYYYYSLMKELVSLQSRKDQFSDRK